MQQAAPLISWNCWSTERSSAVRRSRLRSRRSGKQTARPGSRPAAKGRRAYRTGRASSRRLRRFTSKWRDALSSPRRVWLRHWPHTWSTWPAGPARRPGARRSTTAKTWCPSSPPRSNSCAGTLARREGHPFDREGGQLAERVDCCYLNSRSELTTLPLALSLGRGAMADKRRNQVSRLAWAGRRSLLGSFAFALPRVYLLIVLVPAFLIVIGTLGYSYLEDCSLFDGLYMTVITLTTVGYGEHPHELSTKGRLFTIFLLLGGVFTFFWAASEVIRTIVSGEMRGILERVRMERSLAELKDHLIVCGFGRMGKLVCREFSQQKLP